MIVHACCSVQGRLISVKVAQVPASEPTALPVKGACEQRVIDPACSNRGAGRILVCRRHG